MQNTFFIEIFSEEIPYKTQIRLEKKISQFFIDQFSEDGLIIKDDQIKQYVTQFRIVIYIKDLVNNITDEKLIHYTKQFMNYVSNEVMNPTMRWPSSQIKWVRPIRNILIRSGHRNIIENFFGIDSTNQIYINKFQHQTFNPLEDTLEFYKKLMQKNNIIIERDRRIQIITDKIKEIENEYAIISIANKELIYEISSLTEKPSSIAIKIPEQFLSLPYQLIDLVLTQNQRYIMFKKQNSEEISEHVLIIVQHDNMEEDIEIIKNGNMKVMTARLEDATFYVNSDKKNYTLDQKWDKEKLFNKVAKMELCNNFTYNDLFKIYAHFATTCCNTPEKAKEILEILQISKVDLCTHLVGEFTELQGIIGSYYFAKDYDEKHKPFLTQQYQEFQYQDASNTTEQAMLFLIDRISYIVAMYKNGNQPTSSGDLFAIKKRMDDLIHTIYFLSSNLDFSQMTFGFIDSIKKELDTEQDKEMQKLYQKRLINFIKQTTNINTQNQKNILAYITKTTKWEEVLCINEIIKSINIDENIRVIYKRILPFVDFQNKEYTINEPDLISAPINKYKKDMMHSMLELHTEQITEFFQQYKIKNNPDKEQVIIDHVITFIASKVKNQITTDIQNKYIDHLIIAKFDH